MYQNQTHCLSTCLVSFSYFIVCRLNTIQYMLSFSRVSNWCLVISGQKEVVVVVVFLRDCKSKLKDKCMKIKKNQKSI